MQSFSRTEKLPIYAFTAINQQRDEAISKGIEIIDMGMGNPSGHPPPHVVEMLVTESRKHNNHRYADTKGILPLRQEVCAWYEHRFGAGLNPEDEAQLVLGAKEGLSHLALALVSKGDTVLVQSPSYPIHYYAFEIAGANLVELPLLNSKDFITDIKDAIVKHKPKVLMLSFPANPTAQCVDLNFFEQLIDLAIKHKVWLIHDFAYADLTFDGYCAPSILQVPRAKQVAVEVYSLSKSYNMAGWRIGFVCGNKKIIASLHKLKSYFDYGMFVPLQKAAIAALKSPYSYVADVRNQYKRRRDVLCESLNDIGWQIEKPQATMFVWAKIPDQFSHLNSLEFSQLLASECGIITSPGIGFGKAGEGHVRFSLIVNEAAIITAVDRIKKLFDNYNSNQSSVA